MTVHEATAGRGPASDHRGGDSAIAELTSRLTHWSTDPDELDRWAIDRSGAPAAAPSLLVRAADVSEVSETLRFASSRRLPVVTRGAGTGLAGGATATTGAIILDLSSLNRIIEIRPDDQVAIVEAGVLPADLDQAAAAHGLLYAPDPGSVGISTVGGNIATNAGGLRGVKYGVTRDAVLALDVVLSDGRLVHLGAGTIKQATGYDLVSLVVGSEGTLGVVVRAELRLLPRPAQIGTVAAYFASVEDAAAAAVAARNCGVRPSVIELVDGNTLAAIDAHSGSALRELGEAFLLVQVDGLDVSAELSAVEHAITGATRLTASQDPEVSADLLAARRLALPSIEARSRVVIEDIAVLPSKLVDAIRGIHRIAAETGTQIYVFAHAGDGNVHPIIAVPAPAGVPLPPEVESATHRIFALTLELGGTVTGEHGIGTLKRDWVARELGPDVHKLQRAVREVFDPLGILNPGKAI